MEWVRIAFKLIAALLLTLAIVPLQLVFLLFRSRYSKVLPRFWHSAILYIFGIRVHVHGNISAEKPLLIVANHVSWADILVMGSVDELSFIAKSEVAGWPGIGWLAKLQRTVFVNRGNRRDAGVQAGSIADRLLAGDKMVLFAEGTTGCGHKLKRFNSTLFGAAQIALKQSHIEKVDIQPVAIAYTRLHNIPLGRSHQANAAWPGDLALGGHLLNFLKKGAFDIDVVLGDTIAFKQDADRKRITAQTSEAIAQMFGIAMSGRASDSDLLPINSSLQSQTS